MIRIEGLTKEYVERRKRQSDDGHTECPSCGLHRVLDDINLEIPDGELVCVLGSSGCGKSTFLRILAGFDHPTTGQVLVNDQPVTGPSGDNIFVFQHSGLLPWLTVWENVELGLRNMDDEEKRRDTVQEYIDMVELNGFEGHQPHELSGGMRRRAELARAMAVNPHTLMMDEPFTGLDFITHMKMREEVVNMHTLLGRTMLMVTHFIDDALIMADRIIMFGGSPSHVKLERKLNAPRPRNLDKDEELSNLREELYLMMGVNYAV